ncbi:hypothetical protein SKAU_G00068810 [Synaphobranchus kaupii]|uniref:Uncharacterized protein n=1 Tax=Synaphobranchus kaupii TaxID=118154 RepID=A0A9Q1G6T3_SYNKA|nr:hypothetical protein SKAU_G00068810 [Synaphobranchus kaupii]
MAALVCEGQPQWRGTEEMGNVQQGWTQGWVGGHESGGVAESQALMACHYLPRPVLLSAPGSPAPDPRVRLTGSEPGPPHFNASLQFHAAG